jgi:putative polyhydroxyalkanoate system protein
LPDLHIRRDHELGLPKARKIAEKWAEDAEAKFAMECTILVGDTSDTIEFTRSGVQGRLIVAPDHFELDAKLGFLLGAFSKTIQSEIEKNLDDLLAQAPAKAPAKAAAKAPAKKAAAPAKAKKA